MNPFAAALCLWIAAGGTWVVAVLCLGVGIPKEERAGVVAALMLGCLVLGPLVWVWWLLEVRDLRKGKGR